MKQFIKRHGIIAWATPLALIITLTMTGCSTDGGGSDPSDFTGHSIEAFAEWLAAQPYNDNPPATPYKVKLNISSLGGSYTTAGSLGKVLYDNPGKYVSLDLSGSTFDTIEDSAFKECYGLTSVTIPNGVTSIGSVAFNSCTSLISVTFQRAGTTIANNNSFPGGASLRSAYTSGGIGTYWRQIGSEIWTKS